MRKSTRIVKKLLALFLVVLMSIESFAAVVSDNDGSAFITKAEFDSLKNDFQSQIDQYNTSIDAKIDGAIASYLSGITVVKRMNVQPIVENYDAIRWMHGPYNYLTTRYNTNFDENGTVTNYVDTAGWQIVDMDNRRQSGADMSAWFVDNISARTGELVVVGRLTWTGAGDMRWGYGTYSAYPLSNVYNKQRRSPTVYIQAKHEDDGTWTLQNGNRPLVGEWGVKDEFHSFPHYPEADTSGGWAGTGTVDNRQFTLNYALDDAEQDLTLTTGSGDVSIFADYTIEGINIYMGSGSNHITGQKLHSKIRLKDNPALFQTDHCDILFLKFDDGTDGDYWRTSVQRSVAPTDLDTATAYYYPTEASARHRQHLWATQGQYKRDNDNLYYSMFGSDINVDVNLAPPVEKLGDYPYIDLSESPNTVTMEVEPINFGISGNHPHVKRKAWGASVDKRLHNVEFADASSYQNLAITLPLFYRASWSEIKTDAFKNRLDKQPLAKGAGLPILVDSENAGTITLSFNYEEDSNTDSSVVDCIPDQKIKTYFKTKNFLDKDGKYWSGWTNLNASGAGVSLNGNEWTGGEVTIRIDVKKGDSVWMRIDPLTEDGVYCTMSNYKCNFESE